MSGEANQKDRRPWEQIGVVRRDCEPHRGGLLLLLGRVSQGCGLLSGLALFLALYSARAAPTPAWATVAALAGVGGIGMVLGLAVAALARRDIRRMACGQVDPAGKESAWDAWDRGLRGAGLNFLCLLIYPAVRAALLLAG
jgi:hypothetical protein